MHSFHQGPWSNRRVLQFVPATATCIAALLSVGGAYAQSSSSAVETVVVSGYRQSLQSTEALKRQSTSVVEAVSAEDIGKLPDVSIAESLARLPGLAAQRVDGRSQVVAIRGLSPDFAGTTLNGREQVSTGDNRGVEFDQYPSELLSAAVVYKTPDAKLMGQGLSGTIDLRTVRPLDYSDRRFVVGVRGEYNELGNLFPKVSPFGQRFNVSYVDQFMGGTLGVAIGFAHLNSPFQQKHYTAWWWGNPDVWGAVQPGKPADAISIQGAEARINAKNQVRDGLMGAIEYKPNEHFHSVLDVYYSNFNQQEYMTGTQWENYPNTISYDYQTDSSGNNVIVGGRAFVYPGRLGQVVSLRDAHVAQTGNNKLVDSGAWYNMPVLVRNDHNKRVDVLSAVGWKNEFTFDKLTLTSDLSYSGAKRNETLTETYAGSQALDDNFRFSVPVTSDDFPTFKSDTDYANSSVVGLLDALNYGHYGRKETPRQYDTIQAARLEAKYNFGSFIDSVDVGIQFQIRQKKKTSTVYFLDLPWKVIAENDRSKMPAAMPKQLVSSDLLYRPVSLGFAGLGNVLTYDVNGVIDKYFVSRINMSGDDWRKDFTVKEKVGTAYVMVNLDGDLGFATLRGNVGAQLVHTDQFSRAFDINTGGSSPVLAGSLALGKSYNDFLPSINLNFDFGEGSILRLGVAKTLARPRVDDLRAASTASVDTTKLLWSGNGGNPRLAPWRADSVDVSFEHYFGKASYVSVAGFYKNLRSYIYTQNIEHYDFSAYHNVLSVQPLSNFGVYSTPANGRGGYMRGMEFSTAMDGSLFWDALEGYGLVGSFSWTDSSVKPDGPGTSLTATLPGLSKAVASATAYYEKDGFSFRISERYRSDFRGEISANFAQRSFTRILAEMQTDMQISYEFQEGTLEGMSILAQIENLTDTPYRTVQDDHFSGGGNAPREYNVFGRQFLLGVNYKL